MSEAAVADKAPELTQADTQATQGSDADVQEADALLEELNAPDATETTGEDTEGEGKDETSEVDEESEAAIEARVAERLERARAEEETKRKADEEKAKRKAETEGVDQAFRGRAEAIRTFGRENGWDAVAVERIVATLEAHHAQAAPVTERQMQRDLVEAAGLEEYEWKDAKTFLDDLVEARRGDLTKGTISETQHKRDMADALLAQKRRFQKNPELLTSQTRGASAHAAAGNGSTSQSLQGYEAKLGRGETLTESEWAGYERARASAGLS